MKLGKRLLGKASLPALLLLAFLVVWSGSVWSQVSMPGVLSLQKRAETMDRILKTRLDRIVPELMRRNGIDFWVLIAREYNEDPVVETMLPSTWFSARRRTILLFHDRGEEKGVERLAISRYNVGDFFESVWNKEDEPNQWRRLAQLIAERDPEKIGVNRSETFALADGLSSSEYETFIEELPDQYRARVVTAEKLAVAWLETRIEEEMEFYPILCRIAHAIIAEGLSEKAITPGVTTTEELEWWFRQRLMELDLSTWFHPSVSIQRFDEAQESEEDSFAERSEVSLISPGDLIHVDFGITYLRLNTDTQQHAYLLEPGEREAPAGLQDALKAANRLQDILAAEFKSGRSGNEILREARAKAEAEGLTPSIYTHPLGFHGHAAGPTIGLWDQQDGVAGAGDYPLYPNTAHSIELNVRVPVVEWGDQEVRIMLEEDAFFDGRSLHFIDGRQTTLHIIPRKSAE